MRQYKLILLPACVLWIVCVADAGAAVRARTIEVLVWADVNTVHFDEAYMFINPEPQNPQEVTIQAPAGAENVVCGEGNDIVLNAEAGTVTKRLAQKAIDEVRLSYTLANRDGKCQTARKWPFVAESIAVYVAGQATKLESTILKADGQSNVPAMHSEYAGVYTAVNVAADTNVAMEISGLPRVFDDWPYRAAGAGGMLLILAGGLLAVLRKKKR